MASTKSQDAISLLKEDHRTVEKLFKEFQGAKGDGRKEKLAQQICLELSVHASIEEEIFYPACEGKVEEDLLKESYVEHDAAKLLIAEIEAGERRGRRIFRRQGEGAPGGNRAPRRGRGAGRRLFARRARARSTSIALGSSSRPARRS